MRAYPCRVAGYLLFIFLLSMGMLACSPPSEPAQHESSNAETNSDFLATDKPQAPIPDDISKADELFQNGWRSGSLTVNVLIDQGGEHEEESGASGGTRTRIKWAFTLSAQRTIDVLVAPDLSILLPPPSSAESASSDQALRSAYASSPVYIDELASVPVPTGQVTYTKRLSVSSPNANEYTSMMEMTDGSGTIGLLDVSQIQPSIYGRGYEAVLNLNYSIPLKSIKTATLANGSTTQIEEETLSHEQLRMHLFPAPSAPVFNSYPFEITPDLPEGIVDPNKQIALDIFKILQDVSTGTTLIGDLRPGLSWDATRDNLTLVYSLSSNSQPPLFGDITGLATDIKPNLVKVEILIKALLPS